MEGHRYILQPNVYPSLNTLDTPRPRFPLTDSTGNAQYQTVASANIYSDQKGLQPPPLPPPNFLLPTLPSQPARPSHRTPLEARKSHKRSQRAYRGSKTNPIAQSEQYQAYRSRQGWDNDDDQKWPDDLEELFLEGWLSVLVPSHTHFDKLSALCLLPNMGRRKFSINGKPHGRNELISNWLWLGHCESLRPGQPPDQSRRRTRKQVSSHIQVLKGFMRSHPACKSLCRRMVSPILTGSS
jgi:transcriptional enhancer factor